MKWFSLFHKHTFDPTKWEFIEKTSIFVDRWGYVAKYPVNIVTMYSNACLECGDLVFKKIQL